MTGRWTCMDAGSAARSTRVRGICLAAAMLFALGVVSGVLVRSEQSTHHRHGHGHVAAAALLADGQDGAVRTAPSAVIAPAAQGVTLRVTSTAAAESRISSDQSGTEVPRQRGPPASAA